MELRARLKQKEQELNQVKDELVKATRALQERENLINSIGLMCCVTRSEVVAAQESAPKKRKLAAVSSSTSIRAQLPTSVDDKDGVCGSRVEVCVVLYARTCLPVHIYTRSARRCYMATWTRRRSHF